MGAYAYIDLFIKPERVKIQDGNEFISKLYKI